MTIAVMMAQRVARFANLRFGGVLRVLGSANDVRQSGERMIMRKPRRASGPNWVRMLRTKQCGSETVSGAAEGLY